MTTDQAIKKKWFDMNHRCKTNPSYIRKAITVEFDDYEQFRKYAINNEFEIGLVSHRPDNNLPYSEENLEWVTKEAHRVISGREKRLFNDHQIRNIKNAHPGQSTWNIAKEYNVSQSTIFRIISGQTYKDVN